MNYIRYLLVCVALLTVTSVSFPMTGDKDSSAYLPDLLPRDLEMELALSAAPAHLRAEATVYVLQRGGYVKAQEGSNGFTCIVLRNVLRDELILDQRIFVPVCYDRSYANALLQKFLDTASYIEEGLDKDEIRGRIAEGFRLGKYKPMQGVAISYMLSPILAVPDGRGGIFRFIPHIMIGGSYLTDKDLGSRHELSGYLPWVQGAGEFGKPHGNIIFPVGEKERGEIAKAYATLIAQMEEYINR
ncbi:MAG: hypothetical protein ACE5IY_13110 [bacterium]